MSCKKTLVKQPSEYQMRIVVLGSSTAFGNGASPINLSWVNLLQSKLIEDEKDAIVINLALGGYSTYEAMPNGFEPPSSRPFPDESRNITKALSYHPNLILINFPTNDIAYNYSDNEILGNFSKMTNEMDSLNISYVIFSLHPRNFTDASTRSRLRSLNDKLKKIYTNKINDYYNILSTPFNTLKSEYDSGDGAHVNNAGHDVIFQSIILNRLFIKKMGYSYGEIITDRL